MNQRLRICLIDKTTHRLGFQNLYKELLEYGFEVKLASEAEPENYADCQKIEIVNKKNSSIKKRQIIQVTLDDPLLSPSEQVLQTLDIDFDALPFVSEGESKILRQLTDTLLVERFKPTVYSFTQNRYGSVEGTDAVRARFSAEIFRRMNRLPLESNPPRNAFVALLETPSGLLTIQRQVDTSNLEVRVKRFHIGSPLHRYRYTERFSTTQTCGTLKRWSRFDQPVVCFDWRHPLMDEQGCRLSDEPISDDYAAVWMENIPYAKQVARTAFLWMEQLFAEAGLILVDICFFIDRSGTVIFGEISPDCMRVREMGLDIDHASALDKDLWRNGCSPNLLKQQYETLFNRLFGAKHIKNYHAARI